MKRLLEARFRQVGGLLVAVTVLLLLLVLCSSVQAQEVAIGILTPSQEGWSAAVLDGVMNTLEVNDLVPGESVHIDLREVGPEPADMARAVRELLNGDIDLLLPIGTQATEAAVAVDPEIPVVFAAVTDPEIPSILGGISGLPLAGRITGTRDLWPYDRQVAIAQRIVPDAMQVALLHSGREANSRSAADALERACTKAGLRTQRVVIADEESILAGLREARASDVAFITADNFLQQRADLVLEAAKRLRIPVLSGIPDLARQGAIAAVGTDYETLGRITGEKIVDILLREKEPSALPITTVSEADLYLNASTIRELGLVIPQDLADEARKVY